MIAVNESMGTAQVCVVCSELPEREILINLNEQLGTAQGSTYTEQYTSPDTPFLHMRKQYICFRFIKFLNFIFTQFLFLTAADFLLLNDSTEIVFQSGFTNSTQCVDIEIVDDVIHESSEFFNIILSSSDPNVVIENSMASIVIIDDDGMPVFIKLNA